MHDELKHIVDLFQEKEPLTFAACYPRRIIPPGGYLNPRLYSITLRAELQESFDSEFNMLAHLTGILSSYKLLEMGVPTYFVRSEFAQAVAQTKPPEDFLLSEIKWPLDGMLFCLPIDFSIKTFGFLVPFIAVTRVPKGNYPQDVKLPDMGRLPYEFGKVWNEADRLLMVYPCFPSTGMPVEYTGAFNLTDNINKIREARFEDATYYEEQNHPESFEHYEKVRSGSTGLPTNEQDKELQQKVMFFTIKLMLALTARPGVIQNGHKTRKESLIKCKKTKMRDALWSPNTIGWEYRAQRISGTSTGTGSHLSPRMHWRVGHWHTVRFGKEWCERRLDWFEPVLVNAPEV